MNPYEQGANQLLIAFDKFSDFNKSLLVDVPKLPKGLQQGDKVILNWNHDYVTKNHSSYPIHPLLKIEKIP